MIRTKGSMSCNLDNTFVSVESHNILCMKIHDFVMDTTSYKLILLQHQYSRWRRGNRARLPRQARLEECDLAYMIGILF